MTFDLKRTASRGLIGALGLGLGLALAGLLCLPLSGASAQPAAVQAKNAYHPSYGPGPVVIPFPQHAWAQSFSDITPDPNIRFGTLPNGMRYAIQKNATPPGQVSLRFMVEAGSLMEHDDQQGLAHFLEHMSFRGSTNVKDQDMVPTLERLGLQFGADTNANTGQEQTVFQFNLPKNDDNTVDTGLMLFREIASNLNIDQDAMNKERGVILSEERTRDTPDYRVYKSELSFIMQDNIAARRLPIGLVNVVTNAPNTLIRQFYENYYRPDRVILVAVGDFDPDKMEQKIKAHFSDWAPTGPEGAEPTLTLPIKRGPEAKIAVEPGSALNVSIGWVLPPDLTPDSKASRTADLIEGLGFAVLNRRLETLGRSANPPFIAAGAYESDMFNSEKVIDLDVQGQPGRWREALDAAITEQRRLVNFGITQAELDREITATRTAVAAADAEAPTRTTPELANELVGSIEGHQVLTNPDQDQALFNDEISQVTLDKVNAAMKADFAGSGPLVFIGTPTAIDGGEATVNEALSTALAAPVAAGKVEAVKDWPYTNFGTPGTVASQQDVIDLGTTFVKFANGVRLTVKPTKFSKDQIQIEVRVGAGRLAMSTDHAPADWALPDAFIEGGLKGLTAEEIDQTMNSKVVGVTMGIDDNAVAFSGATRPADFDTEMQLLAAYVTQPGWRPEPFARIKAEATTARDQQDATAQGVFSREVSSMVRSGDQRWAFPSNAEIAGATLPDVRVLLDKPLADGPIQIVIVGDTTVDKAIAAVAATFGALPNRPTAGWTPPPAPKLSFPAPTATPVVLTHEGRADDSVGFIAWKADDFFSNIHKARTLRVLADIINLRLTRQLRAELGATYSPDTSTLASSVFPGYGFVAAYVETPPDKLNTFFSMVQDIAADLREHPVTADELLRAKQPAMDSLQKEFDSDNGFWLSQLIDAQDDPRHLTAIRSAMADLQTISADDVQAAAKAYLTPDGAWMVEVKSNNPAAPQ